MRYDNKGTVVSLGSFSKILAPALRVGWLQASPAILKKIADSGQFDSSGGINPVSFLLIKVMRHSNLQYRLLLPSPTPPWSSACKINTLLT